MNATVGDLVESIENAKKKNNELRPETGQTKDWNLAFQLAICSPTKTIEHPCTPSFVPKSLVCVPSTLPKN
jgi:hypothetical protein